MKLLQHVLVAVFAVFCTAAIAEPPNPDTLRYTKWSGELNVPDPVAISFDDSGRAYVTQTQRRKSQDLDIRANGDWVTDDVSLQSVQQKKDFYHEQLSIGGDDARQAKRVDDMNEDGVHDWRDLMVLSEKIHLLQDTDQDGTADSIGLFAEDFKTEVTGIAAGVLAFEGNVYATIAPDVWRLSDRDGDGVADSRQVIAHGFGLHIAYAGHDMHGLTVGPDGKIYWSIGDKGISVTTADGKRFHYPNQGGVLRCNPDGSDFEVFAHGLRNVQELAFDAKGNLFGVDNDADKPGEKERFVYIMQGMDAGWRCNYQYRGDDYDPWMAEKLWQPAPANQAKYIIPPIRNYIDGPAGLAFNPGTALSPAYRDYFFLTGAPNGFQHAFQVESDGASFRMVNEHQIGEGTPIVGINFGPDGGLYGVDWGGGYPLNQSGAVWKIDDAKFAESEQRREVKAILNSGVAKFDRERLAELLGHNDQRIRLASQFELAKRNDAYVLNRNLQESTNIIAQCHAIWGLGQIARDGDAEALRHLERGSENASSEVCAQIARVACDLDSFESMSLLRMLDDESPRTRSLAALALHFHPTPAAVDRLFQLAGQTDLDDGYTRYSVVMALSACATPEQLASTAGNEGDSEIGVRLLATLALRQQSNRGVAEFLADPQLLIRNEAARAIHDDFSILDALPALAATLDDVSAVTEVEGEPWIRRAINANFRLGQPEHAQRLAKFAALEVNDDWRIEALKCLELWNDTPTLDRVDGRYRDLSLSSRSVDQSTLGTLLVELVHQGKPSIAAASLDACRRLQIDLASDTLLRVTENSDLPSNLRVGALKTLVSQDRSRAATLCLKVLQNQTEPDLRIEALEQLSVLAPEVAVEQARRIIAMPKRIQERARAVALLARIGNVESEALLSELLQQTLTKDIEPLLHLDVIVAAEARRQATSEKLQMALEAYDSTMAESRKSDPLAEYRATMIGGDVSAGKQLFNTHLAAQCARCHRVGKSGSDVGPDLKGVATRRDQEYLLRAMVLPSADIDPKYRSKKFLLASGSLVQGIVQSETETETVIINSQGKEVRIAGDDIEDVFENNVSIMPPMPEVLSKMQIRDLIAYLKTLK